MLIFLQFFIGIQAVVTSSRHRPFCFHNFVFLLNCLFVLYYAHRLSVCVIAVSESHEVLLKVLRLSSFFSTTTPTPSRRRVVIFSTTTQGIRVRRRVNVFSTTSDTTVKPYAIVTGDADIFVLCRPIGARSLQASYTAYVERYFLDFLIRYYDDIIMMIDSVCFAYELINYFVLLLLHDINTTNIEEYRLI